MARPYRNYERLFAGQRFGKWTIIKLTSINEKIVNKNSKGKKRKTVARDYKYECKCECGVVKTEVSEQSLIRGATLSCGCYNKERTSDTFKKESGFFSYNRLFNGLKSGAVSRGYGFELTFEEFKNIVNKNCYYCGIAPRRYNGYLKSDGTSNRTVKFTPKKETIDRAWILANGIDRKDNKEGYTINNSLPCCGLCNQMKMDETFQKFIDQILKITNNLRLKESEMNDREVVQMHPAAMEIFHAKP